jgi:WD40 repeat protein
MTILIGWILGASSILQSDMPPGVRIKHKELISPRGGASFITAVDANTVLTVDSRVTINLWQFKQNENLRKIATLTAEEAFRTFDYCQSSKMFAFSNSNSINNEILFYSISAQRQFTRRKHLKLPFAHGPTMEFRFSPKGSRFAYSSYEEKAIKLLDGKTLESTQSIHCSKYVSDLYFLDESLLLAITADDHASIWDVSRSPAKHLCKFIVPKKGHEMLGITIKPVPNKAIVYYISETGVTIGATAISLESAIKVQNEVPQFANFTKPGWLFRVSPGSKTMVVGDIDKNLRVVNLVTNRMIAQLKLDDIPWSAVFISDTHFLVGCLHGHFYSFSIE